MLKKLFSGLDRMKLDKTRLLCGLILLVYLTLVSFVSLSAPYEPNSDTTVASWDKSVGSTTRSLQDVQEHLQLAQFPGQANIHHSMARSMLAHLADQEQHNAEYWYLLARSLQHQHKFDEALHAIDKALELAPKLPSAWLLKANIYLAQSNLVEAKKACSQLIGTIELYTVATCSLEVASYEGKLAQSYSQLAMLMKRSNTTDFENNEQLWQIQVVADMALRSGLITQAEQWIERALKNSQLADMPLSFIVLWADIQHELDMHQKIHQELTSILEQARFKDDALLVRMAMAEKKSKYTKWQALVATRVQLRLQRQDYYHAADIARYFIYVHTSPQQALKWAKINYQQAKLFDDEKLLLEAIRLNGLAGEKESNIYVSG